MANPHTLFFFPNKNTWGVCVCVETELACLCPLMAILKTTTLKLRKCSTSGVLGTLQNIEICPRVH